jgi:hypothetical protein
MIIPDKINICGLLYKVELSDKMFGGFAYGACETATNIIFIYKKHQFKSVDNEYKIV